MWTFAHLHNPGSWFTGHHGAGGRPYWAADHRDWAAWNHDTGTHHWGTAHRYEQPWSHQDIWTGHGGYGQPHPAFGWDAVGGHDWGGHHWNGHNPGGHHWGGHQWGGHQWDGHDWGHHPDDPAPEPCPPDYPDTPGNPDTGNDYVALEDIIHREADGTGNNPQHDGWGAVDSTFIRLAPAAYEDGVSVPIERENPRDISNAIADQEGDIPSSFGASDLFTFFGQFIDHDIDLTLEGRDDVYRSDVPDGDPVFGLQDHFEIDRSAPIDGTGVTGPREYANAITSYLDASNIYGSSEAVTTLLRADGGASAYMLTSEGDYAPTLGQIRDDHPDSHLPDHALVAGNATDDFYVAGDVRANENVALTSMHTIWLREHNHQVDRLTELHPEWSQDDLFNAARVIVEAEYQNVVYSEYLPLLLGVDNIPDYEGYDPTVNASIAHEFASAAYRLGHSQISSTIHRTNEDGTTSHHGNLNLFEAFFQPEILHEGGGVDPVIRGLTSHFGQEIDPYVVDDVRNLLFGPPGVGSDLAVLNIMRGRDHGIPPLNDVREALGLERYEDFSDLSSDPEIVARFASVYESIDNVDLWMGGLGEDNVPGSQLGSTFHTIVLDQFMRLRDGDQHYFEERLASTPDLLAQIRDTSFSDIIQRNSEIDYLQDDVFLAHQRMAGGDGADGMTGSYDADLMMGYDGDDTMNGGEGGDDLYGGNGNDRLHGDNGDDMINGGHGDDDLWGGWGNDIFVFDAGSGQDRVHGFTSGEDRIDLSAYGFRSWDDIEKAAWQYGHDVIINLENHTTDHIQLIGVHLSELNEDSFIFGTDSHYA